MFHEEQKLPVHRIAVALLIPPGAMTLLCLWQVALGHKWQAQPISNADLIFWTVFLWLVYWRLITVRMVTDVRDGTLTVRLRGIFRRRKIPLADIQSVDPGIETYYRQSPWVVQGTRGVAVKLASGEKVIVGSQKPDDLAAVIVGKPASSVNPPRPNPRRTQ